MKDASQKECESFYIVIFVTLFDHNTMKFNVKFGVIEVPVEPAICKYVPIYYPPPLY